MLSLKHLVATLALGTAILAAPAVVEARTTTHKATPTHTIKHKKHHHVHRKHGHKHVSLHTGKTKHVVAHTAFKHHPQL